MRVKRKFLCFDLDNTLIAGNARSSSLQMAFQKHHLTPCLIAILHRFGMAGYTLVKELYPFLTERS